MKTCPSSTGYFKVDNLFSEIWTEAQRAIARKNLGVSNDVALKWGNIKGDLRQQKDLLNYLDQFLQKEIIGEQVVQQIKYYPDQTYNYNEDFVKYKNELFEGEINSLKDVIDLLMHKAFPVEFKNWDFTVNDITITYTIEKGTKQQLNPDQTIGVITVVPIPGNKEDVLEKITIDGVERDSLSVSISDITNQTNTDKTIEKYYSVVLTTTLPFSLRKQVKASIKINVVSYYFYNITDTSILENEIFIPVQNTKKLTSNEYLFNCGKDSKYISVTSPKKISKVETAAGLSQDSLTPYMNTSGYTQKQIKYTPVNGVTQTYYLIELTDPQSNYVKIRVS